MTKMTTKRDEALATVQAPAEGQIVQALDDLAALRAEDDALAKDYEERLTKLMEPIMAEVNAMAGPIDAKRKALAERMKALENQIRAGTFQLRCTVQGDKLQAVWARGEVKWNDDFLLGLAAAPGMDGILKYRNEQPAVVSIRKTAGK